MRSILLLYFIIFANYLNGQQISNIDTILKVNTNYYLVENNNNVSGNIPIEKWKNYSARQTHAENFLILKKTGTEKFGLVNIQNKKILLAFIYDFIKERNDGVIELEINNLRGLFFPKEKNLINPVKKIDYFASNGNYFLLRNDSFFFFDKNQKLIISKDSISNFSQIRPKNLVEIERNGKLGLIDSSGKLILVPVFNYINILDNGNLLLGKEYKKAIYRRKDLKKLTKIPFGSHMGGNQNVTIGFSFKKIVFYDDNGNLLSELNNADISGLNINSDGDMFFKQNNLWGIVSRKGQIIKKPFLIEYKIIQGQINYFEGKKNNKWEFYDYKGNLLKRFPLEAVPAEKVEY